MQLLGRDAMEARVEMWMDVLGSEMQRDGCTSCPSEPQKMRARPDGRLQFKAQTLKIMRANAFDFLRPRNSIQKHTNTIPEKCEIFLRTRTVLNDPSIPSLR